MGVEDGPRDRRRRYRRLASPRLEKSYRSYVALMQRLLFVAKGDVMTKPTATGTQGALLLSYPASGDGSQDTLRLVRELALAIPQSARVSNRTLRMALGAALANHGFAVTLRCETVNGRIDVLASRNGIQVAIDIERAEVGYRAVTKLRPFTCLKVIVVRRQSTRPRQHYERPAGIHDVVEAP
jgi:hypothetical protein